jgi:hypothetical protein
MTKIRSFGENPVLLPRIQKDAYIRLVLEHLKEDINDALKNPEIAEDCLIAAKDRLKTLEQWMDGEI